MKNLKAVYKLNIHLIKILFLFLFFFFLTCWWPCCFESCPKGWWEANNSDTFSFPSPHIFFLVSQKDLFFTFFFLFIICMSLINCLLSPLFSSLFFHNFFFVLFVYLILFFKQITWLYISWSCHLSKTYCLEMCCGYNWISWEKKKNNWTILITKNHISLYSLIIDLQKENSYIFFNVVCYVLWSGDRFRRRKSSLFPLPFLLDLVYWHRNLVKEILIFHFYILVAQFL